MKTLGSWLRGKNHIRVLIALVKQFSFIDDKSAGTVNYVNQLLTAAGRRKVKGRLGWKGRVKGKGGKCTSLRKEPVYYWGGEESDQLSGAGFPNTTALCNILSYSTPTKK